MNSQEVFQLIDNQSTFVWLKRKVDALDVDSIKAYNPLQMNVLQEERRVYPNNVLMGDVLGFVGMDKGLGGLEFQFDRFFNWRAGVLYHSGGSSRCADYFIRKNIDW